MGKAYQSLTDKHQAFIKKQKIFFVATAGVQGLINISPKGMDTLKVMDSKHLIWLNLTGSGNQTAVHVLEYNRMTLMFCSFDKNPLIMRIYGQVQVYHESNKNWSDLISNFIEIPGARQIFEVQVDFVNTSCGFGVPLYTFEKERDTLRLWAEKKGKEGLKDYMLQKNNISLDGKPII